MEHAVQSAAPARHGESGHLNRVLAGMGLVAWLGVVIAVAAAVIGAQRKVDDALAAENAGHSGSLEQRFQAAVAEKYGFQITSHETAEGPNLVADFSQHEALLFQPASCPADSPVKMYDVAAIRVDITVNRWGDHDPEGYMYALRDRIPAIRAQEAASEASGYDLRLGLGEDPIQPLVIRANRGDCVQIRFTNDLDEPASFTIHGADLVLAASGQPALSTNSASSAMPGETIGLEWYVDAGYYEENTHYIHSHGTRDRYQAGHGLFGAFIVEEEGSAYFDNRTGEPLCVSEGPVESCRNSWDAMISPGHGADFREFTVIYHEIGNERYAVLDKDGVPNPSIDPVTHSYKPNGRAINYRSESFFRRLGELNDQVPFYDDWEPDEAEAYSSYAFGDPAMPIPQSYVGDPAKFRLVHGGSETFHVPHLHGGGIQWQRQQDVGEGADDFTAIDAGLKKTFAGSMPSAGNDSQTIGPSETYDLEISCGSGGCQQTVGDFLFHCHVASHYISGMWHFWRVYNTLQDDAGKTDLLPNVAELPDRRGSMEHPVTSADLLGRTVDFSGVEMTVTPAVLPRLVAAQLPPRGVPVDEQDAAVMDWSRDGDLYLNQPETAYRWPNFTSPSPGERLPFMFDPNTGKLAYPFLRPHLGSRPPFAPHHGPAPFLEPFDHPRAEPAEPGANGDYSLCPEGAPTRSYNVHAIQTEIPVTDSLTDRYGMIYVLKEHEEQARRDPDYKVPLAIRANQGDCVDIFFVNELAGEDDPSDRPNLTKTNIHIHFVQFDVMASDGVITGSNFEQAVRPFAAEGVSSALAGDAEAGAVSLEVDDASIFHVGSAVAIGIDQPDGVVETAEIASIRGNLLTFKYPLQNGHEAGQLVSGEFVRYRWYVARQNGAIYFHDHVDALVRWGHGLFGALIAEPRGASYHHPQTGEEITSGPIADIHNRGEVVPGLEGSFREFVLFMNDRNPLTGSSFNLRAEPLRADTDRGQGDPDVALSSVTYGDPATPVLRAYVGDPIVLRLLTSATEEIHPFHITGHTFRQERFQEDSPPITFFGVGISERFNAYIAAAGGASGSGGDYLYYNGAERHFMEGAWGILRVHDTRRPDLMPLPGREPASGDGFPHLSETGEAPPQAQTHGEPCPADAPRRSFRVSAIDRPLEFNTAAGLVLPAGRMFVLDADRRAVENGTKRPEPLVIRANAGDCITIRLANRSGQPASLHLDSPTFDPQGSLGITLGFNPGQAADPGRSITYRFYAQEELGTVMIRDFGNLFRNAREGLYGALIVEKAGSTYHDPYTGDEIAAGVSAVIRNPADGDFREFVTIFEDTDPDIGLFIMPYDQDVNRLVGVNYRTEPFKLRLAALGIIEDGDEIDPGDFALAAALLDSSVYGDPATNIFETYPTDRVVFRVAAPYSEQNGVFSVEGHQWMLTPTIPGSDVVSSRYLPPTGVLNVELMATGGPAHRPGDYVWGNHRMPYMKAGQWGLLRVLPASEGGNLLPLDR